MPSSRELMLSFWTFRNREFVLHLRKVSEVAAKLTQIAAI